MLKPQKLGDDILRVALPRLNLYLNNTTILYIFLTGNIDLSTDESLGGSYQGVDAMGFLWSMKPSVTNQVNSTKTLIKLLNHLNSTFY